MSIIIIIGTQEQPLQSIKKSVILRTLQLLHATLCKSCGDENPSRHSAGSVGGFAIQKAQSTPRSLLAR